MLGVLNYNTGSTNNGPPAVNIFFEHPFANGKVQTLLPSNKEGYLTFPLITSFLVHPPCCSFPFSF